MPPDIVVMTPCCRICGSVDDVIGYPDDHSLTICPNCCDDAEHHDGETGHVFKYDQWERGSVCQHCGIPRRDTEYAHED